MMERIFASDVVREHGKQTIRYGYREFRDAREEWVLRRLDGGASYYGRRVVQKIGRMFPTVLQRTYRDYLQFCAHLGRTVRFEDVEPYYYLIDVLNVQGVETHNIDEELLAEIDKAAKNIMEVDQDE